jgi:AcrR family transcriptional regulator
VRKERNLQERKARRAQKLNRESEIYQKALDLFIKRGYDATPMSMIAKTLGMSQANLYYYCSSKENLLYQIHLDDLRKRFIPIINQAEQLPDPKERIAFFIRNFTLICASNPTHKVVVNEIRSLSKGHQHEIISVWRRAYDLLREAIEELQKAGKARKFRKSFLAFLGAGMVFWIDHWWDYSRQTNAVELAETLVQTFLHGLLYPENEAS